LDISGSSQFSAIVDGGNSLTLMPAFIDLHAHFRDTGTLEKESPFPAETVESGSLAAAAGGYGTLICMANTRPVTDTSEKALVVRERARTLGLIDLYPVLPLTKNMEGRELVRMDGAYRPLLLSEDGKDLADDDLFLEAMKQAKQSGLPVSCHCDLGGENNAVRRVIGLGRRAGCHVHIAHVSTKEAVEMIREAKKSAEEYPGFKLSCEATPHHFGATEEDARRMGEESFGRVNPPLRAEADRQAILAGLTEGTIDAIATDHAPHSEADKAGGAPGFSGLEIAFALSFSYLTQDAKIPATGDFTGETGKSLRRLSRLMSANPARILGLQNRGRIAEGLRADFAIVDTRALWKIQPAQFRSRGKCSPFDGRELRGKVVMTTKGGQIVYDGGGNV
jgi:dihydroorotase